MGGLPGLFTTPSSYLGDSLGLSLMYCNLEVQTTGLPEWCMGDVRRRVDWLVVAGGEQVIFLNPPFIKGLFTKQKIEMVLCLTLDN